MNCANKIIKEIESKPNLFQLLQEGFKNSFKEYKGLEIYERDHEAVFYDRENDKIKARFEYVKNE